MESKVYQYKTEYDLNDGTMYVNTYNGGMVYTYPLVSIGENTFKINVGLIYNSNFKESFFKKIIMGNEKGWKLNIEELVIKYDSRFNLDGFIYSDYVYVDSMWNIHRFVQYKVTGSLTEYYDESGTGLKLKVEPNKDIIMVDEENNERIFDKTTGKLIKVISSINQSIKKVIEYDNFQRVIKVYDSRKQNRYISFSYDEESNLTQVTTTINSCYYTLEYENNLTKINEQVEEKIRPLIEFSYDEFYLLSEITTPLTNDITKLEYDNDLLTNIITGKLKKELITETVPSENYLGENLYLGDGKYLMGESLKVVETKNVLTNENTIEKITYSYQNSYTDITNRKGIKYRYSFDITGRLLTILEVKDDHTFYTLNKETGWSIEIKNDDNNNNNNNNNISSFKLNNKNVYHVQKNSGKYQLTIPNKEFSEVNEYYSKKLAEDDEAVEQFNLSFYLMFKNYNDTKLLIKFKYRMGEYYENVSIIQRTYGKAWQKVTIPFKYDNIFTNFADYTIEIEEENANIVDNEIYISNIMVNKGTIKKICIKSAKWGDLSFKEINIGTTLYYLEKSYEKEVTISPEFYLTENDIQATYKSIYYNKVADESELPKQYDLYYCNKTKVKSVGYVSLESLQNGTPNKNYVFASWFLDSANGVHKNEIPNYRIRIINLTKIIDGKKYNFVSEVLTNIEDLENGKYNLKTRVLSDVLTTENMENVLQEETLRSITTKSSDGKLLYNQINKVTHEEDGNIKTSSVLIKKYEYDDYGNLKEEIISSGPLKEVIVKEYRYMESYLSDYEYVKYIIEEDKTTEFSYTDENDLETIKTKVTKKYIDGSSYGVYQGYKNTIKYTYDEFKRLVSISFYDKDNKLIHKNFLNYNQKNELNRVYDALNSYGFIYSTKGTLLETYHNKNLLERYTIFDNNVYRKYTTYTYQNNQENKIQETYDTLDRITSIEYNNENEDVLFEYEDDETYSPSLQRINKINDNINKINYTYNYEDTNIDGTTTTLNIVTPKLNYSIETKPNNTITYSFGNEKIKQEVSSDDLINNLPTKSYTYVNNSNNEFEKLVYYSYDYEYDNLGRPTQKQGLVDEYSQATIQTTKNISYYPKEIKYTTLSKLKETGNKQQAEITYKNSYIDGRITKVVEEETRFKENPKNASSQNTLTEKTTKVKTFKYDDFGRLIEETTDDGSTIKYTYGTGIKQVERIKNNETSIELYEYTTGKCQYLCNFTILFIIISIIILLIRTIIF